MARIKIAKEVAKALEYITYDLGIDVDDILKAHKFSPKIWVTDKQRVLRNVDYSVLEQALKKGYEVANDTTETVTELDASDNVELQPQDYEALLMLAVNTVDKAWFDELVMKSSKCMGCRIA